MSSVTIVIPAFNEEDAIADLGAIADDCGRVNVGHAHLSRIIAA